MNEALNYAQQQADTFKNSLQYLIEQQNQQKMLDQQALTQRYTNLVNQINQQKTPIQQRYSQDTQGAYVNKMLAGKQLEQNLSQMGLNTQGFGVTQQMLNENAYGQTLGNLAMDRNTQLQNLQNQLLNTQGQQQADLYSLDATYAGRLADINKYITESTQQKYNTEYARKLDEIRYQDQLKQLALDNAYRDKQSSRSITTTSNNNPFGGSPFGGDETTQTGSLDAFGNNEVTQNKSNYYFANSTQPRYINNTELTRSGQKAGIFNLEKSGVNAGTSVWTANGKYYVWSSTLKDYIDVTEDVNENRTVSSIKSPGKFSSQVAQRWFTSNIAKLTKPTVAQLKKLLTQGYQDEYIDDADIKRILATYGLE